MQIKKKLAIIGIITIVLAIIGFVVAEMTYMKYNTNDPYSGLNEVIVEKRETNIDATIQHADELSEDVEIPKKPKLDKSIKKKEIRRYNKKSTVTNKMSSINGIQVSAGGEFDVKINGIDFHILSVYVYCPNEDCYRHRSKFGGFNWSSLMDSDNAIDKAKCEKCGTEYDYSCIDWIRYNCPVCGEDDCYTQDDHNFCRNCGTDLRPYHKILLNNKWESR